MASSGYFIAMQVSLPSSEMYKDSTSNMLDVLGVRMMPWKIADQQQHLFRLFGSSRSYGKSLEDTLALYMEKE